MDEQMTDVQHDDLELLFFTGEAIRLTREYVGEQTLPPLQGWSWFDAYCAIAVRLDSDGMHQNIGRWVDDYEKRQKSLQSLGGCW